MTISNGTRLGPFELTGLIGQGGMGTVYRARDTRLERDVAIKLLPPGFASDPDRLRRFEQEARAAAQLAHPNILALHDIGTHEGAPYIVMELLEGSTLRERMGRKPLPVTRALDFAMQVARGLAAAHDRGIVHRDIKPDNLFVTHGGQVKILDFGLAKLTQADHETGANADTMTMTGSGPLGTAAYMAPEQARGDARVDHRADLFSLGVVLYEMLSGVSPFRRETGAETMTAILRDEPADLANVPGCSPSLQHTVRHCLEKLPADRFQNARDLAFSLETISPSPETRRTARVPRQYLWPLTAAALIATATLGYMSGRRNPRPVNGNGITSIHRLTDFGGLEEHPAIAPDLKSVAFTARVGGFEQIFIRLIAGGPAFQVTRAAANHESPRWSADASTIFYFSPAESADQQGSIWSIPALGGAPRRVIDSIGGTDVGKDGRIACFRLIDKRVELLSAASDGSDVRVLSEFDDPVYYRYPRWSPDSKWIAYQRGDGIRWDVFAVPATGGPARQLTQENRHIQGLAWMPDARHLVYSSNRGSTMPYLPTLSLWEVSLDGGEPRLVVPGDLSYLQPDVHSSGDMVASRLQMHFNLWRYPIDGSPQDNVRRGTAITRQTAQVQTPTIGMHDREVAFLSDSGGHANLWIVNTETSDLRQITYERDPNVSLGVPIWSPVGKRIAFVSSRGNTGLGFSVWVVDPDGGNQRQIATRGLGAAWSLDGQWLFYVDGGQVYKVPAVGGDAARVRGDAVRNVIGYDGRTLYFVIDRTLADGSPGFEIHAASPETAPSRVIAQIPARRAPQWQIVNPSLSPNGDSLAMPLTDGVTTNIWTLSTLSGEWKQVTDFQQRPIFIARRVSWAPDGRSIVAAVGEGDTDVVLFSGR